MTRAVHTFRNVLVRVSYTIRKVIRKEKIVQIVGDIYVKQ